MLSTVAQIDLVQRTYDRRIDMVSKDGFVQREIDYFRENIGKIETGDQLLDDYRLYSFAMKAFGLESQTYAKGLMRKVFNEGVTDKEATANQLVDRKYYNIAAAFGFAETGNLKMLNSNNVESVVQNYVKQELEEREGESSEPVRLALYFERKIGGISNWYEILADPALAEVARTAAGMPESFSQVDIDKQAAYYEEHFSLDDLKDTDKLQSYLQRFGAQWDLQNGVSMDNSQVLLSAGIAPIQPLKPGTINGIDPSLLAELGKYRI